MTRIITVKHGPFEIGQWSNFLGESYEHCLSRDGRYAMTLSKDSAWALLEAVQDYISAQEWDK